MKKLMLILVMAMAICSSWAYEAHYGSFAPGENVSLHIPELVGFAAKGLPSGLRLDKKSGTVSGTPKKPGTYETVFTKKGVESLKIGFTISPFPTISILMEGDTEKCKVAGASKPGKGYAVGKKVNLAAKSPKGTAFVGWFMDGVPWPDAATYIIAKQKYVMTAESLVLVARFEKEKMSVACPRLSSPLVVGKAVSIPIEIDTQSGVKSVKGVKLPTGLKVKKVDDVWYVVGTPKKKGTFSAEIKVTAKSGAVEKLPVVVIVGDGADVTLPDWAVGTFHGWECWIEQGEDETNLDMDLQLVDIGRNGSFVTWSGIQQGWVDDQDRVGRWWSVHYPEDYLPTRQDDGSFVWSSTGPIKGVHPSDTKSAMQTITVSKFMYGNAEIGILEQDAYYSFRKDPDAHQHAELIQDPWSLATRPEHLPDFSSTGDDVLTLRFWSYYGEFSAKLTFTKEGNVNVEWSVGNPQTTYARLMPYRYDSEQGVCHATLPIISGGEDYGCGIILDLTIPHPDTASAADVGCSMTASSWQVYELKSAEMME